MKITDYGISRILPEREGMAAGGGCHSEIGTPDYMAPEVINGNPYAFSCDIYAFGVVVNEMASRRPPWADVPAHPGRAFAIMNQARGRRHPPTLKHPETS